MTQYTADQRNMYQAEWYKNIMKNNFLDAIKIDFGYYKEHVKKNESVENWDWWFKNTLPTRKNIADILIKQLPDRENKEYDKNKICLVYPNYSGLAHETQLARVLNYLKNKKSFNFDLTVVYLFMDFGEEFAKEVFQTQSIVYLRATNYIDAANKLDDLTLQRRIGSIIYPSIFFTAYWISLFNRHPNQKFLQMKYYPLQAGRIKRWAGGMRNWEDFYTINGDDFEQLPVLDLMLAKSDIEINYEHKKNFGSISRIEKIVDLGYNRLILKLLDSRADVEYVFTGREGDQERLPKFIKQHKRTNFWGWVNPNEKIAGISLYLEPFPWGGGDMTFLALSAGIPYLTLRTDQAKQFGILSFLELISVSVTALKQITQYSFCDSEEEYFQKALELIDNSKRRTELGSAWKQTMAAADFSKKSEDWMRFLTD